MRYFWVIVLVFGTILAQAQDKSSFVNVFIGTDGTGHTFPGPSMPFGMVQPGPDNSDMGWSNTSGYQYRDSIIMGFSQTRFSGTGINEMGDVMLLPFSDMKEKRLQNLYFKKSEKAAVGYYSVTKKDDVKVELTCSERVALHKYTFPDRQAKVLVDLQHGLRFIFEEHPKGLVLDSDVKIENNTTISGYCSTRNWVKRKYFFTIRFDKPFIRKEELPKAELDKAPKYVFSFQLDDSKVLKAKIALSTVDVAGAKLNMLTEMPGWDFEKVRLQTVKSWNSYLNRIEITADAKQKEILYTSLYHFLLQPSNIADVNGKYRGADDRIALAPNKTYYSTLSIWDIYRGAFPLLELIVPERVDGIIQTLLLHHKAAGFLPIWTVWGQDNYCMIGNHSIPMILSAFNKGFKGFDKFEALKAMKETSTKNHINSDWDIYNQYGYYPFDKLDNESVSRTLESGYDDWCVAQMAMKLGDKTVAEQFSRRAGYYKNLFDSTTKLFRGRDTKGSWRIPFNPLSATSPMNNPGDYTEANAWQYFWTPGQYDVEGIIKLLGGVDRFTQHLNTFFTLASEHPDKYLGQEAMIGQYAHGNEPSHHIIYLYSYSSSPKTGQKYIHQVVNTFHNNTPDGMIGNDDCGQMSAWYILSCLGFYPVNAASNEFVLGAPQLKKATLTLAGGKQFIIEAPLFDESNIYWDSAYLNGKLIQHHTITYSQLLQGGVIRFDMVNK